MHLGDIEPAAGHARGGREAVRFPQRPLECAVATHGQTRRRTCPPGAGQPEEAVHQVRELLRQERPVAVSVRLVGVETAMHLRHHDGQPQRRDIPLDRRPPQPDGVVVAQSVQQIEHRRLAGRCAAGHADLARCRLRQDHRHRRTQTQRHRKRSHNEAVPRFAFDRGISCRADSRTRLRRRPNTLSLGQCPPARSSRHPPRSTSTPSATSWTFPSSYPPDAVAEAAAVARGPGRAGERCRTRGDSVRHTRSGRLDGPGPGSASEPAKGTGIWFGMRSPTSPRSSRPAARSRPRPGAAAPPSTARTPTPRCTRSNCPRVPPACCRACERPAVLWTIHLDDRGEPTEVDVRRTAITSVAKLNYPAVQIDADAGTPAPVDRAAAGDRQTTAATVAGTQCDQPGHPGFGDRPPTGRAVDAGAPGDPARRAVQRRDQSADRHLRGHDHVERRDRAAPDPAVADQLSRSKRCGKPLRCWAFRGRSRCRPVR